MLIVCTKTFLCEAKNNKDLCNLSNRCTKEIFMNFFIKFKILGVTVSFNIKKNIATNKKNNAKTGTPPQLASYSPSTQGLI